MMKRITSIFAQFLVLGSTAAAPATFKCTTAEGSPAADLVVDVENKTMMWGIFRYRIHAIDDRYISAYLGNQGEIGGEVWVLNRASGEYTRASVSVSWESPEAFVRKVPGRLS